MKKFILLALSGCLVLVSLHATTYYISKSATASDSNTGKDSAHSWRSLVKSPAPGDSVLFRNGDDFTNIKIPTNTATTATKRIYYGHYYYASHFSAPIVDGYSVIKSASWSLYKTNVWKMSYVAANLNGFVPSGCNIGVLKVDNVYHGLRRGVLSGLKFQWDFYCDMTNKILYVYSTSNPSGLATTIEATNGLPDKLVNLSKFSTFDGIAIVGAADAAINIEQPNADTIRNCNFRDIGGEMKQGDTTRQGEGVQFYNGGTNSYAGYDTVSQEYEAGLTMQVHTSGATPISFTNCVFEYNRIDSCESGFNPTIDEVGSGYVNCKVQHNYFGHSGYGWSHSVKPNDNQAIALLSNGFQTTLNDIDVSGNTVYLPREGVYYIGNGGDIPYIAHDNDITLDSNTYIWKSYNINSPTYTWKLKDSAAFVAATGQEKHSHWHCNNCIVTPATYTFYRDADGDGFGDAGTTQTASTQPAGYVNNHGDCDDNDATVYPGAREICDGKDNNCDGQIDEKCTVFYHDADHDGYGNITDTVFRLTPPLAYVSRSGDCDDADSTVYPGAVELCDGKDNNCDGIIDENCDTVTTQFSDSAYYGYEQKLKVIVTVTLSKALVTNETVYYSTVNGTAIAGVDYVATQGSVIITAGSRSANFIITLIKQRGVSPTKYFTVRLTHATTAQLNPAGITKAICYDINGHP